MESVCVLVVDLCYDDSNKIWKVFVFLLWICVVMTATKYEKCLFFVMDLVCDDSNKRSRNVVFRLPGLDRVCDDHD